MDRKEKTKAICNRLYDVLCAANERIPSSALAGMVGCSRDELYHAVSTLRRLLEERSRTTISSLPGHGYRLAGLDGGRKTPAREASDALREASKSGMRVLSHATRQRQVLEVIDRKSLQDPDLIEEYSINVGMATMSTALRQYAEQLQKICGPRTKARLMSASVQVEQPAHRVGMMTFSELIGGGNDD